MDAFRDASELPAAGPWTADRPAETDGRQLRGARLGVPGPNQGYVLTLVRRFHDRVTLAAGEDCHDVDAGVVAVALKRASLFGRAPMSADLEVGYGLFGFLSPAAPPELVAARTGWFAGAGHHYETQRAIADRVPEATLRMTPTDVAKSLGTWRSLVTN